MASSTRPLCSKDRPFLAWLADFICRREIFQPEICSDDSFEEPGLCFAVQEQSALFIGNVARVRFRDTLSRLALFHEMSAGARCKGC